MKTCPKCGAQVDDAVKFCSACGPAKPNAVAEEVAKEIGAACLVVDINDLDGVILGVSNKNLDRELYRKILSDNPLGQDCQQTPMGIIRPVS